MKARSVKKLDPDRPLDENAARLVRVRLDEMLSFGPKALAGKTKAQHDMRIAAKRLRYVLELTDFIFGRPAETARRRAREVQDLLGEIHDCDVMLPRVRRHVKQIRRADVQAVRTKAGPAPDLDPALSGEAPNHAAYRGLETLAVHLEARRLLLLDRFAEFWRREQENGTWLRLDRAAQSHLCSAHRAPQGGGTPAVQ